MHLFLHCLQFHLDIRCGALNAVWLRTLGGGAENSVMKENRLGEGEFPVAPVAVSRLKKVWNYLKLSWKSTTYVSSDACCPKTACSRFATILVILNILAITAHLFSGNYALFQALFFIFSVQFSLIYPNPV